MAVIGALLIDPNAMVRVAAILTAEMFYVEGHRILFKTAAAISQDGAVNQLSVIARLKDTNQLRKVGGGSTVYALAEAAVSSANIDQQALLVRDQYIRRKVIGAGNEVIQLAYDVTTPLNMVIDKADGTVFKVTHDGSLREGLTPQSEILVDVSSDIEVNSDRPGEALLGIPSGFFDIDKMTDGFQNGDLIISAGRPSMGKTALWCFIALNVAIKYKIPVAFFSLEMSKQQIVYRLLSSMTSISAARLRIGRLSGKDWEVLLRAIQTLAAAPIFIDDTPNQTVWGVRKETRRLKARLGTQLITIVDYLQLMESDDNEDNPTLYLSKITRGLKHLSKELKIPVVALSQLSREVEGRTNKRPLMKDLRSSGAIEQDADLVALLYREDYYTPDTPDRGVVEVNFSKHRNGPTGVVKLLFDREHGIFLPLKHE